MHKNQKNIVSETLLKEILAAINSLKYGYVQIMVHNSKIVQIEKTEKRRFDETKGGES
jgi:hypothetical protein